MTPDESLRTLYAAAPMDHRAIAIAEREAWEAFRVTANGKSPKRERWFRETFGVNPPTHAMFRAAVLSHEPWSEPLWALVDGFGIGRIYRICNDLKLNPKRDEEVARLVGDPDSVATYKVSDGGAIKTVECSPGDARDLRVKLRELVKPFVEKKLAGLDEPGAAEEFVFAFEIEIQSAFGDLLRRIDRLRRTNGAKGFIVERRRELSRACEVLGLKLPKRGGAIDMDVARKAHRKLSAQFHPDRTNGNEQMTAQYHEVQRAWEIISAYQP
jgi:hypothetical protein